jgi:hypothetical protein
MFCFCSTSLVEIATYSSILDREEARVQLSLPQKKRKACEDALGSGHHFQKRSRKSLSTGPLRIHALDLEGKVTLENTGVDDIPLEGWQVKSQSRQHVRLLTLYRISQDIYIYIYISPVRRGSIISIDQFRCRYRFYIRDARRHSRFLPIMS